MQVSSRLLLIALAVAGSDVFAEQLSPKFQRVEQLLIEDEWKEVKNPEEIVVLLLGRLNESRRDFDNEWLKELEKLPKLRTLSHYDLVLSDVGLKQLSQCKQLEALVINDFHCSDESLALLKEFKNLKTIGLFNHEADPKQISELLPDVYVEVYTGRRTQKVFDANGCPATYFRKTHLSIQK